MVGIDKVFGTGHIVLTIDSGHLCTLKNNSMQFGGDERWNNNLWISKATLVAFCIAIYPQDCVVAPYRRHGVPHDLGALLISPNWKGKMGLIEDHLATGVRV